MRTAAAFAIINFVWQGAAIGLVAWLGFALSRSPRVRYLIGVAALALMAAAPVVTGVVVARVAEVHGPSSPVHGPLPSQVLGPASGSVDPGRGTQDGSGPWTVDHGPWTLSSLPPVSPHVASLVLAIWLIGVGMLSARLAIGFAGARRLTRRVSAAGADVQVVATRLVAALRIRAKVRVVESALVKVPAVIGALKPVVLLPMAAMSGLSMAQVEALLAHELAHIRRHDYLVNLLQSAVETLLFYHPAVWLVSRRVRQERELCCDDLALAVCTDRVAYASALADLESSRAIPSPALAATGGSSLMLAATGGSLLARVRRILGHDDVSVLAGRSKSIAGIAILAAIILLAGGQAARARAADAGRAAWSPTPPHASQATSPTVDPGRAEWVPTPAQESQAPRPTQGVVGGVQGGVSGGVVGGVGGGVAGAAAVSAAEKTIEVATERPQAPADPPIATGQIVRLEVSVGQVRQSEFNKDYTVQPDGTIVVPYVGAVKAAGLTTSALQASIAGSLNSNNTLPGAKVAASVETRQMPTPPSAPKGVLVTVQGAVRRPGSIPLREDRETLLDAIGAAGGLALNAGRVIHRHGDGSDIYSQEALINPNLATVRVQDGDVITVEVAPRVYVTGYVKTSTSEFNWEPGMTLQKAIALAGGIQADGAGDRITISRKDSKTGKFADATLDKDPMNTVIEPDDVIKVPRRDGAEVSAVQHFSVSGYVKNPGQYGWEVGMTLQRALAAAGETSQAGGAIDKAVLQGLAAQTRQEWGRKIMETQDKKAAWDSLAKIDLNGDPVVASQVTPGFSSDRFVVDLNQRIREKQANKQSLLDVEQLGPQNSKVQSVNTDITSLTAQLKGRLAQIVESAHQEYDAAKATETRYETLYRSQQAQANAPAGVGALNRATIERKDMKSGKVITVKLNKNPMTTPIEPGDVIKVPLKRM